MRDLQKQERKLLQDIRKEGEKGNKTRVRDLAKQLVRVRKNIESMHGAVSTMDGVKMQAKQMATNLVVAESMQKATKVAKKINDAVKPEELARRAAEYEREMERANVKQEVMDDALAAAFDDEANEDEADDVVNRVLDEIGIQNLEGLEAVPMNAGPGQKETNKNKEQEEEGGLLEGL